MHVSAEAAVILSDFSVAEASLVLPAEAVPAANSVVSEEVIFCDSHAEISEANSKKAKVQPHLTTVAACRNTFTFLAPKSCCGVKSRADTPATVTTADK